MTEEKIKEYEQKLDEIVELKDKVEKIKKKSDNVTNAAKIVPVNAPDIFQMDNGKKLQIKSVKLKYLVDGSFNLYSVIDNIGVAELLKYSDGMDVLCKFLSAVFDKPYTAEQIKHDDDTYTEKFVYSDFVISIVDELTINDISNLIGVVKKVNGITEDSFFPAIAPTQE